MSSAGRFLVNVAGATAFVVCVAVPLSGAHALPVSIANGSFELGTPNDAGNGFTTLNPGDSTSIIGWSVGGNGIDWIGTYWMPADGNRSLDLNGMDAGSVSQTITGLIPGQTYTVTFDLAGNPAGGPEPKTLSVTASAGPSAYTFDATNTSLTAMGWLLESFSFTPTGNSVVLAFTSTTTGFSGNGSYPNAFGPALDNVSIAATPLPAALPLFAGGLGMLGLLAKRRKRKAAAVLAPA